MENDRYSQKKKRKKQSLADEGHAQLCREKGLIRSEGKDYVMQDGDVTLFRFNV